MKKNNEIYFENGEKEYLFSFTFNDEICGFSLFAYSKEEVLAKLEALKENAKLDGYIEEKYISYGDESNE